MKITWLIKLSIVISEQWNEYLDKYIDIIDDDNDIEISDALITRVNNKVHWPIDEMFYSLTASSSSSSANISLIRSQFLLMDLSELILTFYSHILLAMPSENNVGNNMNERRMQIAIGRKQLKMRCGIWCLFRLFDTDIDESINIHTHIDVCRRWVPLCRTLQNGTKYRACVSLQ